MVYKTGGSCETLWSFRLRLCTPYHDLESFILDVASLTLCVLKFSNKLVVQHFSSQFGDSVNKGEEIVVKVKIVFVLLHVWQ